MKKFLALFAALTLAACSGDDDKNEVKQNKFVSTITVSYADTPEDVEVLTFLYDDQKHVKSIVDSDETFAAFTYQGDNLVSIADDDTAEAQYNFTYANDIFSGYSSFGELIPITHNAQANTYTLANSGAVLYVSGRDVGKIVEADGTVNIEVTYDTSKKGALYNVPGNNLFVLTAFSQLYPYISSQAMTSITESSFKYTANNTYDNDGYISKSILTSTDGVVFTLSYTYKAL